MVINMKFGEIIKELLEQNNITQKHLAKSLDISASALGNYIQCRREPDYNTLIRIADYFHVSPLLSHDEELLIQLFRSLSEEQKEFYLEQGKIFIRQNRKKESSTSQNTFGTDYEVS